GTPILVADLLSVFCMCSAGIIDVVRVNIRYSGRNSAVHFGQLSYSGVTTRPGRCADVAVGTWARAHEDAHERVTGCEGPRRLDVRAMARGLSRWTSRSP